MTNIKSFTDKISESLSSFIIKYKYIVVLLFVGVAFMVSQGAKNLTFSPDYRIFFSGENPELQTFVNFQNTYTKNDNFYFVVVPSEGTVFNQSTISALRELTESAWSIPYTNRVDSVVNFQHTFSDEDGLVVKDLLLDEENLTESKISEIKEVALNEPLLSGLFVTETGNAAAVNVVLQLPRKTVFEVPTAAAKAREIKANIEASYPGLKVHLTGFGMLNNAFGESGYLDSVNLVPMMYLTLIIVSFLVLRSFIGTFITVVVAYLSMGVGMGVGGYFGIYLTPVSNSAPILIITLAIADSIHFFLTYKKEFKNSGDRFSSIRLAMRQNILPITVTSLTTVVGFLSLNFSDSPPYWHLGNMAAVGIASAWVLSLMLFPAFLAIIPQKRFKIFPEFSFLSRASESTAKIVTRYAPAVVLISIVGSGFLIYMIPTIKFDDQWVEYFDESIQFRRDTDSATEYFGLYPIEYSVPALGPQGVSDPEYLEYLDEFKQFLLTQDAVHHVYSITDIIKRLNYNINEDQQDFYEVPAEKDVVSDYLLIYELSLPYGLDLNDRINIDKSASRVTVLLNKVSTQETKLFLDSTQNWINENFPEYMRDSQPTSAHVMFTYITDRNVASMIQGTVVAILIIGVILAVCLRSTYLGAVSLVSNFLPILAGFGVWALLIGQVGFSIASVAAISLGIVVDDTVHFLSKYNYANRVLKLNPVDAISYTYENVAPAIIGSTVVLVSGLIVMAGSTFKMSEDLGLLTILIIVFALVYDLLLLPAILFLSHKLFHRTSNASSDSQVAAPSLSAAVSSASKVSVIWISALGIGAGVMMSTDVEAQDSFAKGYEISAASDRTDRGFHDSEVEVTMILKNASGAESKRVLNVKTFEVADEDYGDKSLVVFREPSDILGTALLSHAQILSPDNQWLFLNSIERIKRISSRNKSGPFMGSEFAFEDFTSQELNKYDHEWLSADACGELQCDLIKRTPKYKYSGYSYLHVWIDQDILQIRKIDFYDRKSDLLKTLELKDYQNTDGVWRSHLWSMTNHQTKKITDLIYGPYQFNLGLNDTDFVKARLRYLN